MKRRKEFLVFVCIFGLMMGQADAARLFFDTDNNPATEETTVGMSSGHQSIRIVKVYMTDWEFGSEQVLCLQFGVTISDPEKLHIIPWYDSSNHPGYLTHANCELYGGPFYCSLSYINDWGGGIYEIATCNSNCVPFSNPLLIFQLGIENNGTPFDPSTATITMNVDDMLQDWQIIPGGINCTGPFRATYGHQGAALEVNLSDLINPCGPLGDSDLDGACDDGDNSSIAGDNQCIGQTEDCDDNCPSTPNGFQGGTCVKEVGGVVIGTGVSCTASGSECATGQTCQMNQGDINGNGIGDACECYADFNHDGKVSTTDLGIMKLEFFRTNCATVPCQADANGDNKVDTSDLGIMKVQFFKTGCPVP